MNTILDNLFCEWREVKEGRLVSPAKICGLPAEIDRVVFMHSTDPAGHTAVATYRCPAGHSWNGTLEEEG